MVCQHLEELYELYLLGALDSEDDLKVREHVEQGCLNCTEQLREAAQALYLVARTARRAQPDPKLKALLLRRVRKR